MTRRSRRRPLAHLLDSTGIDGFIERTLLRRGLLVCNYHRVAAPAGHPFDDATISATPDEFQRQVHRLRATFDAPSIDEIADRITRRCDFDRPTMLVTFDDGYHDNYANAFAVLRSLGVPGLFFVVSDYVEQPRLPWWDRVAYVLKCTAVRRLEFTYPAPLSVDLASRPLSVATRQVLRLFKDHGAVDQGRFFDDLERQAGVDVDADALARGMFMTWSDLREMHRAGMRIGSHTRTHRVLAHLDEAQQRAELTDSRAMIAAALAAPVDLLSYPVGGRAAFTPATMRIAADVGYRCAFSYYGGFNARGADHPFDMRRIDVELEDDVTQLRTRAALNGAFGRAF